MQACRGAAQFNLRPMPREHDVLAVCPRARINADVGVGHSDGLAVEAPLEAHVERPAEQRHLEPGEGQNGPESLQRENDGDATGGNAGDREKHPRTAHAQ